jgi:type VI secretion system protein ImpM
MKIGFFGKLPGYGDFVQRNVSPDFVKYWDNWVLKSLSSSREQLGDLWRNKYFNSPIWRFVISQDTVSQTPVAGFIMPSVDKAGRCYPFTVVCQAESEVNPFIVARKIDLIHEVGEDFALSLLENIKPDLDEITNVLNEIYQSLQESKCQSADTKAVSSVMELACITEIDSLDFTLGNESFLQILLKEQNVNMSIWSMGNTEGTNPQIRYFSGMPPTDNYYSFLVADEN